MASSPELKIKAGKSSWSRGAQSATFEDEVEVVRGDVTVTCQRLELHHDGDGAVDRAIAIGKVRITRDTWTATGDRAELEQASGQLILLGAARLEEEGKILQGERISIALEGDSVTCEDCSLSVGAN